MNISTCTKAQCLASPFGENIVTSSFQMMLPNPGEEYTPVLLHCDMKDLSDEAYGVLKDIYTKEVPPLILLTYDRNPKDDAVIIDYITNNDLGGLFDATVSIHNEDLGFQDGYGTLFNNLPFQLEEKLDAQVEWGKLVNVGNKTAEAIGSIFNKPVISLNVIGRFDDVSRLEGIMNCIEQYPDYNYSNSITQFNPKKTKDVCVCCGKRRSPLKFFYKIQGHLCQACETKIKQEGEVNILNWYKVGLALKKEREQTRKANIKQNVRALSVACPVCGSELRPRGYHKFFCPHCKELMWVKGKYTYRVEYTLGKSLVYQYNDAGKLMDSFAVSLTNGRSEIIHCEICQNVSPDYVRISMENDSPALVCKECLDSAPGGIEQIKKILKGGEYHV